MRSTRTVGWRSLLVAALGAAALIVPGVAASAASAETTWLCKPGLANNPCLSSEETTVQLANGSSFVEHAQPASNPPIDCFYVYPTVSSQVHFDKEGHLIPNADLNIDPEETQIAIDQASRFSQTCKVYAPIYPQLTTRRDQHSGRRHARSLRNGLYRRADGVRGIPRPLQPRPGLRAHRPLAGALRCSSS